MNLKNEFVNFHFQEGDWVVEFDPDCLNDDEDGGDDDIVILKIIEEYGDNQYADYYISFNNTILRGELENDISNIIDDYEISELLTDEIKDIIDNYNEGDDE